VCSSDLKHERTLERHYLISDRAEKVKSSRRFTRAASAVLHRADAKIGLTKS